MKRALVILGLTVLAGAAFTYCGGSDSSSGKDPAASKALFASPDGTVTDANAVMTSTLNTANGSAVQGLLGNVSPNGKLGKALQKVPGIRMATDPNGCFTVTDANNWSVDLGCVQTYYPTQVEGCTVGGTWAYEAKATGIKVTVTNFTSVCASENVAITEATGTFTAEATAQEYGGQTFYMPTGVFCVNMNWKESGSPYSVDACWYSNEYLVDGTGGSVTVTKVTHNDSCTEACGEFKEAGGTVSVTCTVAPKASLTGCTSMREIDITKISSCVIASGGTCPSSDTAFDLGS